jgi:hypothetical protein
VTARTVTLFAGLALACAPALWHQIRAEHPATRAELAIYPVTVLDGPAHDELAQALAAVGFIVVAHPPYKGDLAVRVKQQDGLLVATVRSDDWFVDQLEAPDPRSLAEAMATSQRIVDFIRNSGTIQQRMLPGM